MVLILKFSKQIKLTYILTKVFIFIILFSTAILANELKSNNKLSKAFAAPTGPNSVDEIEVDGLIKTFVKVGGFRDGIQKGIFDETESNNKKTFDFEQKELQRGGEFSTYDDNSLIDSNREDPLFIPIPYRKKTTEEEKVEKKLPSTKRPVISPGLNNNKLPIPVRTTPVSQTTTLIQSQSQFISQNFVQPQSLTRLPIIQPHIPQFMQQPLQNFVRQPPRNLQLRPVITSQFNSHVALQKTPIPSQLLKSSVHQQTSQRQPSPTLSSQLQSQNSAHQQAFQQHSSLLPQPQSNLQSQIHHQTFQKSPLSLQPQAIQQPTSNSHLRKPLPQHQLLQPPRIARPFQSRNNFVNLSPRPQLPFEQQNLNLRTGAPASSFDIQFTYSHFASVVSVDQCARTCYEFNCAYALFDAVNRHCQFNPSTSLSVSKDTCPNWPNPIYRNNFVVVGQASHKISCITCQKRQKGNRHPFVLKTTDRNHVNQHSLSHSIIANAAVHGVILEQPRSIAIGEKYDGQNIETFENIKFLSNEDFRYNLAAVARTTIKPLANFNSKKFVDLFASQPLRNLQIPSLQSLSVDKRLKKSTNASQIKNILNVVSTK